MATRARQSKEHFLEQWIDGSSVKSALSENSGYEIATSGFAWQLYEGTLKIFEKVIQSVTTMEQDSLRAHELQALRECLSRLYLWGEGYSGGQLDKILQRSDELKYTILEFVTAIAKILLSKTSVFDPASPSHDEFNDVVEDVKDLAEKSQYIVDDHLNDDLDENFPDFNSETGSDGCLTSALSMKDFAEDIKSYVSCLMALLPAMEHTLSFRDGEEDAVGTTMDFHVSDAAQTYINNVRDRFKDAKPMLVSRLGEANYQRHIDIRRKMAAVKEHENDFSEEEARVAPVSAFIPCSMFHDSGLGTSIGGSNAALTQASHSSFRTDKSEGGRRTFRVPEPPVQIYIGKPFPCNICGHVLKKIKSRYDWKIHVFADLQPYICTFSDCKDALVTFPTRRLWEEHELLKHRTETTWACPRCPEEFHNVRDWDEHLHVYHESQLSDVEVRYAMIAAQRTRTQPPIVQRCPLCLKAAGDTQRSFTAHVCKHMETIALAALPNESTSDSEEDSSECSDEASQTNIRASVQSDPHNNGVEKSGAKALSASVSSSIRILPGDELLSRADLVDYVPRLPPLEVDGKSPVPEQIPTELYIIKCICQSSEDDGNTIWCETCDTWQHVWCYYPGQVDAVAEADFDHSCVCCKPRNNPSTINNEKFKLGAVTELAGKLHELPQQNSTEGKVKAERALLTEPYPSISGPNITGEISSYWSVPEQTGFPDYLRKFGSDWLGISKSMGTKTHIMIKNYYLRQLESGRSEWGDIVQDADNRRGRDALRVALAAANTTPSQKLAPSWADLLDYAPNAQKVPASILLSRHYDNQTATEIYQQVLTTLQAQYPDGIPDEVTKQYRETIIKAAWQRAFEEYSAVGDDAQTALMHEVSQEKNNVRSNHSQNLDDDPAALPHGPRPGSQQPVKTIIEQQSHVQFPATADKQVQSMMPSYLSRHFTSEHIAELAMNAISNEPQIDAANNVHPTMVNYQKQAVHQEKADPVAQAQAEAPYSKAQQAADGHAEAPAIESPNLVELSPWEPRRKTPRSKRVA